MAASGTAGAWRVVTAAEIGAYHLRTGLAYEDACEIAPADARDGASVPTVAVAVADGHGHARHFRSARGAKLAVEIATKLAVHAAATAADAEALHAALHELIGPLLVARWRRTVEADIDLDPITTAEISAAGLSASPTLEEKIFGYGSTVMVALATSDWLLAAQIGDGNVFAVTADGKAVRLVPDDPQLDGWRTTSLCQPDALQSMRFGAVRVADADIGAVLLATDGYGNAQAQPDWEVAFAADLAALREENGIDWIAGMLPSWVSACASPDGSGDDVTAALLFRTEGGT